MLLVFFSSEPDVLEDFLTYISASKNPAINSLMYIPLNAVIVVEIYRNSRRKDCPMPKTMTQVYTQLCLTILQRHLDGMDPQNTLAITKFSDLPSTYYAHFKTLSQLAFEQFDQHRIVFYSDSVSEELVHFGFLNSVPALYGGGEVSYNFLHLTLQEFLAAFHITQFSNGIDVFKCYAEDRRWEVVWRFVSGLTSFQYFKDNVQSKAFGTMTETGDIIKVEKLLLHCLFEGQVNINFKTAFGCNTVSSRQSYNSSPLDRYALGYCIANSSSTTTCLWDVYLWGGSGESFIWGLNSNPSCNSTSGIIRYLQLEHVDSFCLNACPQRILRGITSLDLNFSPDTLVQAFPAAVMTNLNTLSIESDYYYNSELFTELLRILSHSNVTSLALSYDLCVTLPFLGSLANLINPKSGKLKELHMEISDVCDVKSLCETTFGSSSLTTSLLL